MGPAILQRYTPLICGKSSENAPYNLLSVPASVESLHNIWPIDNNYIDEKEDGQSGHKNGGVAPEV